MIELTSRDAALLMKVLERQDIPLEERHKLLAAASPTVCEIGEALLDPGRKIDDPEIRHVVESIRSYVKEFQRIVEERQLFA